MDPPALLIKGCLAMKDLCQLHDAHQHRPLWPGGICRYYSRNTAGGGFIYMKTHTQIYLYLYVYMMRHKHTSLQTRDV